MQPSELPVSFRAALGTLFLFAQVLFYDYALHTYCDERLRLYLVLFRNAPILIGARPHPENSPCLVEIVIRIA